MGESGDIYELTQREAQLRSSILSNVKYDLRLSLTKSDCYAGILLVEFSSSDACESIWLDFKGTAVKSLKFCFRNNFKLEYFM